MEDHNWRSIEGDLDRSVLTTVIPGLEYEEEEKSCKPPLHEGLAQ